MQEKFQFRLNADIHGDDEAEVLYTATHDGGCYVITWEDENGEGSTMYGAKAVESIVERGSWIVQ